MDADGHIYASLNEVPPEDVERLRRHLRDGGDPEGKVRQAAKEAMVREQMSALQKEMHTK